MREGEHPEGRATVRGVGRVVRAMSGAQDLPLSSLRLEYCGEWIEVQPNLPLVLGRDADLVIDENPFLHRRFLEISGHGGMWWLTNVGACLSATISDDRARVEAWLAPGAHLPVVFEVTVVRFTAGPTSYELSLHLDEPPFSLSPSEVIVDGTTTLGRLFLTPDQRLLVLALAAPALEGSGRGATTLPTSAEAAARLGWPITKFNRKLDNVCQKLKRAGVRGLHGDADRVAAGRKARLVEHALAVGLVSSHDLFLLDGLSSGASV